jgi:hypothetical protein
MAGDFVIFRFYIPDKLWMMFSHPSKDEKSSFHPALIEQLKNLVRISFDPALEDIPVFKFDKIRKSRHHVIIFDIYSKGVEYHLISVNLINQEKIFGTNGQAGSGARRIVHLIP